MKIKELLGYQEECEAKVKALTGMYGSQSNKVNIPAFRSNEHSRTYALNIEQLSEMKGIIYGWLKEEEIELEAVNTKIKAIEELIS